GLADEVDRVADDPSCGEQRVDELFAAATLEPALEARIVEVATRVAGGGHLAVRSSATVEDLTDSSFAGQYRSVLDVDLRDGDALLAAVRAVFASLHHPAPRAYRRKLGLGEEGAAMA